MVRIATPHNGKCMNVQIRRKPGLFLHFIVRLFQLPVVFFLRQMDSCVSTVRNRESGCSGLATPAVAILDQDEVLQKTYSSAVFVYKSPSHHACSRQDEELVCELPSWGH